MRKIGFIVDSTFCLSEDYVKENDIYVVPLNIIIDNNSYRDNIDITLYEVMDASIAGKKVTSSQPSPLLYHEAIKDLLDRGYEEVVVMTISSTLSGTYQAALLGAEKFLEGGKVFVHDTLTTSAEAELLLRIAVEQADLGKKAKEVLDRVSEVKKNSGILMSLKDLDSLFRGGRLSKLKTIVGNLLNIKPIVAYVDGKANLIGKKRTDARVYQYFVDYLKEKITGVTGKIKVLLTHINAFSRIQALKEVIVQALPEALVNIAKETTPVLAVHVSYGGIGMAWAVD
jgi:DegV family protein with EDD domain